MDTTATISTLVFLFSMLMLQVGIYAQDPAFTNCPEDIHVSVFVGQDEAVVTWVAPKVTSTSDQVMVTSSRSPGDVFPLGDTRVTYVVTDGGGHEETCAFTVTVVAPRIYGCPDRLILQDNVPGFDYAMVTWLEPRIADQSGTSMLTSDHMSGEKFYIGQTTVTYILTDEGPFAETCRFVVEIRDAESPMFTSCPDNIHTRVLTTESCNQTYHWLTPTAIDNSGQPQVTASHRQGISRFDCGSTAVTYTAVDAAMNVGYCTFNITVDVGGYENCPANVTGETSPGLFTGTATWTPPTVIERQAGWSESLTHSPGDSFRVGVSTVTYTLADRQGFVSTCSFTVTIIDVESPIIVCPEDVVVTATNPEGGTEVTWPQLFTSDNVYIANRWSNHRSGDEFDVGSHLVIYGTNDSTGHTAFCNFTVTVQDYVVSLFTRFSDYTFVGNDDAVLNASDVAECLKACIDHSAFMCRSAEFTSTGQCRLSENIARTNDDLRPDNDVTYFEKLGDNTPPTLTNCPYDLTRRVDEGLGSTAISWLTPTASDDGEGQVTLSSSHQSGDLFDIGETEVVYTATDEYLNHATCSFTITIIDDQRPIIQDCPESAASYLHNELTRSTAVNWNAPFAYDNSGQVTLTVSHAPGSVFEIGDTVVTYTATDPSGNEQSCAFIVSVVYIQEHHRFSLLVLLPNLAFSDSLADVDSDQYSAIKDDTQQDVQTAFAQDVTFLDTKLLNITKTAEGGVEIEVSLGFSERVSPADRREELDILLSLLTSVGGVDVQDVLVIEEDGPVIVDACFTLPCPSGMTCTIQGSICVSYCSDNPTYCLNEGFCVKPHSADLVGCQCASYEYFGTRCERKDRLTEPRVIAAIVAGVWAIIVLLLFVLCFPFFLRRCLRSKDVNISSSTKLVKPDVYRTYSDDDCEDDYDSGYPAMVNNNAPIPQHITKASGKINPAFIGDNGIKVEVHDVEAASPKTDSPVSLDTGQRLQGDGSSFCQSTGATNEDISLSSFTLPKNDIGIHLEHEITTELEERCRSHIAADVRDAIGIGKDTADGIDAEGEDGTQAVKALVHNSDDGNFVLRSTLTYKAQMTEEREDMNEERFLPSTSSDTSTSTTGDETQPITSIRAGIF